MRRSERINTRTILTAARGGVVTNAPKVVVVDVSRKFGGANARSLGMLAGYPGGRAVLACLGGSPVFVEATRLGIPAAVVGLHKLDPRIVGRLVAVARAHECEVLDTQNAQSQWFAARAARTSGLALVSTLNSWYEDEHRGGWRGRIYQALQRRSASRTDGFIAVSREIAGRLRAEGIGAELIAVIPNAIAIAPESVASGGALRRSLGLPDGATLVAAVGRLVPAKGYADLIDAIALLDDPSVHVVIAGEGESRRAIEARIESRGLSRRIRLLGAVEPAQALRWIQCSDLFVMASVTEGTPVALLEAAALAKPIVTTSAGGIPDIVQDGVHARIVPPAVPEALASAIRSTLSDPEAAQAMGDRARRHVEARHGRAAQIQATIAAYAGAIERRRRAIVPA